MLLALTRSTTESGQDTNIITTREQLHSIDSAPLQPPSLCTSFFRMFRKQDGMNEPPRKISFFVRELLEHNTTIGYDQPALLFA